MPANKDFGIKKFLLLASPLLLFPLLLIPYSLVNRHLIVKWLGCSCPRTDAFGNIIPASFNANDFTALFWLFITLCATVMAFFLCKRIPKEKLLFRILYVSGVFLISLFITHQFCLMMQWK